MQQPSSPSCTVAGGAAGGGGDDGVVIPPEYLRWLIDDDDGFLHRTTTAAEAEPSPGSRAAAAPTSHSPMQRQPSLSSCAAAGGGAVGDEEDPFGDIIIPPDLFQWLDDHDGWCLHGAGAIMGVKAEDERRLSSEPPVGGHSLMQQLSSSSPSCPMPGEGSGGDKDPFDDIEIPKGLLHDDEEDAEVKAEDERHRWLAEALAGGDGDCVEDRLLMTYRGLTLVFDSVPLHKVETIRMILNGYELAPDQSAKPRPTNLVHPIGVPQDFDRAVAMSRYRNKRKITVKADYSVRREITSSIARRRGKFVPSEKSSDNSVGTKATELQSCANCGASSMAPRMRRGPSGTKNFCNACGLAWATYKKIRNVKNAKSRHGGSH